MCMADDIVAPIATLLLETNATTYRAKMLGANSTAHTHERFALIECTCLQNSRESDSNGTMLWDNNSFNADRYQRVSSSLLVVDAWEESVR